MRRFLVFAVVVLSTCAGRESLAARTAAEREARHAERDGATPRGAQHGDQGDATRGAQGDKKPDQGKRPTRQEARQGKTEGKSPTREKGGAGLPRKEVGEAAAPARRGTGGGAAALRRANGACSQAR